MPLRETIESILTDAAKITPSPDLSERLVEVERIVAHHLKVACDWIDRELISEPIQYSEDLGNLVEIAEALDHARKQVHAAGISLSENLIHSDLVDRLNAHYIKGADAAPLLGNLRESCYQKTGPLEMMLGLRAIRRAFPRERRFHTEITKLEETLAKWIESSDRDQEELASFLDFMSSYQARTPRLKSVHGVIIDERNRLLSAAVEHDIADVVHRLETESEPSARVIGDALNKITNLRATSCSELNSNLCEFENRLKELRRDAAKRKARHQQAELAIAALERSLDEKGTIQETEVLYANARKEAGELDPDLEARVRRRLEIEKSVRIRRVGSVIVAIVAVAIIATWWFIKHEEKVSRQRLLQDVVNSSEAAMESGSYEEVAGIVEGSSESADWLLQEPRVIAALTSAQEAIEARDQALVETCKALTDIADRVEGGEIGIGSAQTLINNLMTEAPESISSLVSSCQTDALDRVAQFASRLAEIEEAAMQRELQSAETARREMTASWRDAGARMLLQPGAFEELDSSLKSLLLKANEAANRSPELTGLQSMRRRLELLAENIELDLERLRQQQDRLAAGLEAVRATLEPTRSEAEFAHNIRYVLQEHPATLEDIGRFSTFESTSTIAVALVPLQAWRDRFSVIVLDALALDATTATKISGLEAVNKYLQEHPDSMLDEELKLIRDQLDSELQGSESLGTKTANELQSLGLHDLRRIETTDGWVYARPSKDKGRWHYLSTVGDLAEPANALPLRPPVEVSPGARPVRSESSRALEDGLVRLRSTTGSTNSVVLLEILQEVRNCNELDPQLTLTIQDLLWQAWRNNHRRLDPEGEKAISKWLDRLYKEEREVITSDWVTSARTRRSRLGRDRDARILTRSSPDPDVIATRIKRRNREVMAALEPVLPVGIVLPSPNPNSPRAIRWLNDVSYETDLVVPVRNGQKVLMRQATLNSKGRILPDPDMPREAILIFRTARPRNQP